MAPERPSKNSYLFLIIFLTWLTHHPLSKSATDAEAIWEEVHRGRFFRIQSMMNTEGDGLERFLRSVLAGELSECSLGVIWCEKEEGKAEDGVQEGKKKERGIREEGKKEEEKEVREERKGNEIRVQKNEEKKEEEEKELIEDEEMDEKIKNEKEEGNERKSREEKKKENGGYDLPVFNVILASPNPRQVS